jgi:hypothetical protein
MSKTKKILIVEDDRVSYEYLREVLSDIGAEIVLATNGQEVVEMCKSDSQIALVFMDIKIPLMTGIEATQILKEIRPDLPIIAQTAYALDNEREIISRENFVAYMAKPLQREEILSLTHQFLK